MVKDMFDHRLKGTESINRIRLLNLQKVKAGCRYCLEHFSKHNAKKIQIKARGIYSNGKQLP
jgi:hypothetical protein